MPTVRRTPSGKALLELDHVPKPNAGGIKRREFEASAGEIRQLPPSGAPRARSRSVGRSRGRADCCWRLRRRAGRGRAARASASAAARSARPWVFYSSECALGPEAASSLAGGALIGDVGGAVAAIGDGESVCHHRAAEVGPRSFDARDRASMNIYIDRNDGHRPAGDQREEVGSSGRAATLVHLGRIDAVKTHALPADDDGVAVDNVCPTCDGQRQSDARLDR